MSYLTVRSVRVTDRRKMGYLSVPIDRREARELAAAKAEVREYILRREARLARKAAMAERHKVRDAAKAAARAERARIREYNRMADKVARADRAHAERAIAGNIGYLD